MHARHRTTSLLFMFITLSVSLATAEEPLYYISPGLRIGWSRQQGMTVGFKVSLGLLLSHDHFGQYINMTFGARTKAAPKHRKDLDTINYLQLQTGFGTGSVPLCTGGGIGMAWTHTAQGIRRYTLLSIDAGFIGFLSWQMCHRPGEATIYDVGLLGVAPIPLNLDLNLQ